MAIQSESCLGATSGVGDVGGGLGDVGLLDGGDEVGGFHGRITVRLCAVAELAVVVLAHGPEAAVRLEEETVSMACGDLRDARGDDLYGGVPRRRGAVAQLAVAVVSHGVEAAVRLQEEAMV